MAGTILFMGANGSSDEDPNTWDLREVISRNPNSHASIHQLDMASLDSVHGFATELSSATDSGQYPPLKAIVADAFYRDLVGDSELTVDSFDKPIQTSHISHVALILRIIRRFSPDAGPIVLLSSVAHFRKKTHLLRPYPDKDKQWRGFQRYSNAKLLITTWIYPLNRYLSQNPKFQNITAIAANPGGLGDSRCFRTNTPRSIQFVAKFVLRSLIPVINRLANPTFRSSVEASIDMIEYAVNEAHPDERGYFTLLKNDESDPLTWDLEMQTKVWKKSAEWARITKENTALADGL
ncbi:putative short-chain dehydrogenase [Xylaria sp. FL0933]|nr:putative short-chain dehydrogenase [Xylaria sp. FL0933]